MEKEELYEIANSCGNKAGLLCEFASMAVYDLSLRELSHHRIFLGIMAISEELRGQMDKLMDEFC